MHQMVGGSDLSGVLVHRPRCGHASSSFEAALAALGAEDVAAKMEVEAALERNREEKKTAQPTQQARWGPDAVREHARCKVRRFEEALKAMGDMQGSEVEFLQEVSRAESSSSVQNVDWRRSMRKVKGASKATLQCQLCSHSGSVRSSLLCTIE